ncbi:hypothetical protein ABVG11_34275 [Streptomyces sp. HD1123-B1]|uniref:hypothetical protein n=1 Tax=Streptomyces huangiella TaxID=3228804 RepID=UPI003D7DB110
MADTIHVRGEGGQIIEMSLPLPEPVEDRLIKGQLRRVNADGSPYTGSTASPVAAGEQGSALTRGETPRPPATARKAEWVGWAVGVHGMDPEAAEAMTKQDLMDLPEHPADPDTTPAAPAAVRPGQPPQDAPKSEWIAYIVSTGQLSAEDAANYTKADLIDMAK